jgi:hypothetical protein
MLQDRLRVMEQQQERGNARLQEMDQDLNQGKFDLNRIGRQSHEIEQAMKSDAISITR